MEFWGVALMAADSFLCTCFCSAPIQILCFLPCHLYSMSGSQARSQEEEQLKHADGACLPYESL